MGAANGVEIDDRRQVADVSVHVVVTVRRRRALGSGERNLSHALETVGEKRVRFILNPAGDRRVSRATVGRVVLESSIFRGIVRGRDHNAVGELLGSAAVVREDRVRDDGRRSKSFAIVDHYLDVVRSEDFERRGERRFRERVGVDPHEERTIDAVLRTIETDRLGDGEDVLFVERALDGCSAVARGPERDPLRGDRGVGLERVVRRHESRNVGEYRFRRRLTGQRADSHSPTWLRSFLASTKPKQGAVSFAANMLGAFIQAVWVWKDTIATYRLLH